MSYSLQSLTHANDLNPCPLPCCGISLWTAFVHCENVHSSLPALCLLWAGTDFAKTLKTILSTKLTSYLLSEDVSLPFSWLCRSGFFPSPESYSVHEVVTFLWSSRYVWWLKGRTPETRVLCLVSESSPVFDPCRFQESLVFQMPVFSLNH